MKAKLELFIGPCVIESQDMVLETAHMVRDELSVFSEKIKLTFKTSFDKANRTSVSSYRGPGIDEGLKILAKVKKDLGLPVLTDFHLPEQADPVASIVDMLQVPAFLCRQTDMIISGGQACDKYGIKFNVKKGQFLSPESVINIVEKAQTCMPKENIYLTERGVSFGYNNLIVDMASFAIMKSFDIKTIYDATHSVQKPSSLGDSTGGKRENILVLAKAAVAAGADGIFMEVHENPSKALSDPSTSIAISDIKNFVETLLRIYEVV